MVTGHEEHEEDQDSLFGSPPPSPRISTPRAPSPALALPSASICDSERRLSISTDTQNVGTIALPGSHPYSELPINPLALSLNHSPVHRPPAQSQEQPVPTSSWQRIQPSQPSIPAANKSSYSLPGPSARPPAHFLRNKQNLLGKAGLVAGVKHSTITHIRGATPSNPIIIDDEDTPVLGRQSQSRDARHGYVNPGLLTAPTNEDIVSVLIGQKDIFPVLEGILSLIGKRATRHIPTPPLQTRDDPFKHSPVKRRKLNRVPAGASDWDVPYPFHEGEGPDEYYKTWERERGKHLIAQLVKLIKIAARKAATKNYLRKEQARQAAWEKLQQEMIGSEHIAATPNQDPAVSSTSQNKTMSNPVDGSSSSTASNDQSLFNTWMTFLQAFPVAFDAQPHSQSGLASQDSTPGLDDFDFSSSTLNAAVPDDLDAVISSMLNSLPHDMESIPTQPSLNGDDAIDPSLLALSMQPSSEGENENLSISQAVSPVPSMSSSGGTDPMTPTSSAWEMSMPDIFMGAGGDDGQEGGSWEQITRDSLSGMMPSSENINGTTSMGGEGKGKGKEVVRTNPLAFLSADATPPASTQGQSAFKALIGAQPTDIVLPPFPLSTTYEQQECPTSTPVPVPRPRPRPKNTISQPRKEEILRRAREKRRQVQEELDQVKTQLWETTVEQAALVHLLKRCENE